MRARHPVTRSYPGTRPVDPVRSAEAPDCWLCSWSFRQAVWSLPDGKTQEGFWELKYINSACLKHVRLAA